MGSGLINFDMDTFQLSWTEFGSCASDTIKALISDKEFTDVTLALCDGKQIKAHKVILSARSPFFKNILVKNPHQHPLVYLKGVSYDQLRYILEFIYVGQTEVDQDCLNDFMMVAKDLQIKGLISEESTVIQANQPLHNSSPSNISGMKREVEHQIQNEHLPTVDNFRTVQQTETFSVYLNPKDSFNDLDQSLEENEYIRSQVLKNINTQNNFKQDVPTDLSFLSEEVKLGGYPHKCDMCDYGCSRPIRLRKHKESKHGISL